MADIFNLSDTWNDGATTFKGIGLNVTDTASASGSLLMDLQVGGSSRFSVRKDGEIIASSSTLKISNNIALTGTNANLYNRSGNLTLGDVSDQYAVAVSGAADTGVTLKSAGVLRWTNGTAFSGTADLFLRRDAADTLAQRRSTNPQAFRVYNTYTDASNYEQLSISFSSNIARIEALAAGTGVSRLMLIRGNLLYLRSGASGNGSGWDIQTNGFLYASSDNSLDIGAATNNRPRNIHQTGYIQTSEMTAPAAPAANGVRIYAEDDGAGKTRLMALFATGAAQQLAIEP
jgi:hypothetical protein